MLKIESNNQQSPLVTVILSVYNDENNIFNALSSISSQTYTNFEAIIINDCSSDNTLDIVKNFIESDSRFKLINNEINLGLTKSLNKGISFAKGHYIARLDSDDISLPKRLQTQVEFMEKNSDFVMTCGLSRNTIDGIEFITTRYFDERSLRKRMVRVNCVQHSSVMIRTCALQNFGIYDERFLTSQDYELWLRFLTAGLRITMLPDILINRKITNGGISRKNLKVQAINSYLIRRKYSNISLVENVLLFFHQYILGILSALRSKK